MIRMCKDMKNKPLLSICIPTYNRANYLINCLESIVHQDGFDENVEVVISDNCSDDNTEEIGKRYEAEYENVKYYRNEENVIDANYSLVLKRATGCLRKLTNDTLVYTPGAILQMVGVARRCVEEKPLVYFFNAEKGDSAIEIDSINHLLEYVGHWITWIGSVAIWDDDVDELNVLSEMAYTRLSHVPFLFKQFEKRRKAYVYDKRIISIQSVTNKDLLYGLYKVFYTTFLGFIKEYVDDGIVSNDCYEMMRKELLLEFFCPWIIQWKYHNNEYRFSDEDLKELVEKEYEAETYFRKYKRKLFYLSIKDMVRRIVRKNNV